ncbi:ferredoxin (plasmid) [Streptomyces sp. BI20]|uniref:ferredoxin n=1 Tax=Streptomyces sp. BI20 TaxID=3403460 RepID=UPI003C71BCED
MWRVLVDLNRCQGYAQCAFLAPSIFRMDGIEGLLARGAVTDAEGDRLAQAVAACPTGAILTEAVAEPAAEPAGAGSA